MTFVGTVINFSGNEGEAVLHRLAQAAKSLVAWRQFLRSPIVALKKRLKLLISTVFALALWLSESWLPTKQQREHLTSWGARMVSSIAGFSPRLAAMNVAQFWRAFHRRGHRPRYGYHVRRPPSVETAPFCRTSGKIERSGPVAACQDSLSVLVAERTSAIPFKL